MGLIQSTGANFTIVGPDGDTTGSGPATFSAPARAHSTIVVLFGSMTGGAGVTIHSPACSDDKGNLYTLISSVDTVHLIPGIGAFICNDAAAGVQAVTLTLTLTATLGGGSTLAVFGVIELTGTNPATASAFVQTDGSVANQPIHVTVGGIETDFNPAGSFQQAGIVVEWNGALFLAFTAGPGGTRNLAIIPTVTPPSFTYLLLDSQPAGDMHPSGVLFGPAPDPPALTGQFHGTRQGFFNAGSFGGGTK